MAKNATDPRSSVAVELAKKVVLYQQVVRDVENVVDDADEDHGRANDDADVVTGVLIENGEDEDDYVEYDQVQERHDSSCEEEDTRELY